MKHKAGITALVTMAFALTSLSALAQGGRQADRPSQVDRDRTYDRDRQQDQDRLDVADRDRDRLHVQDFSQLRDQDIYGSQLMSAKERNKYRGQPQNAKTAQEREQLQGEHSCSHQLQHYPVLLA